MTESWMPREQWEALVKGVNCPLCAEVKSTEPSNEYGYMVADLSFSRLRLCLNQYVKGYCVLICHKHVREPYELPQDEREMFFDDMMRAGLALENVFRSVKMNFQILGNAVPHLHCHLQPRYYGDPSPHRPIDPEKETVLLKPEAYQESVAKIRVMLDLTRNL
ncbi:MAG: HIT family protein [Dehalococcoidales bacterium]|jgi:diadenosine tetraphosphate (Ap4A) HIT family hydrolase